MVTTEQYEKLKPFKDITEMYVKNEIYVGGADPLFDILEKEYGQQIDRGCKGCIAGFLKYTHSLIKQYEDGSTKG